MNIAILTGGETSEREIALRSANVVKETLLKHVDSVKTFDFPNDLSSFLSQYQSFDCTIPVFHGKGGEDGTIQGFLRTLNIPFIFSDVEAQAIAMNKVTTKTIVSSYEIQTPKSQVINSASDLIIDVPIVIKPISAGSSTGIIIAHDKQEALDNIENALNDNSKLLIEEYISGREFAVAVINKGEDSIALPIIEIQPKSEFFDFESKYNSSLCNEICPAQIDNELAEKLSKIAIQAHSVIGAKHVSRSDFIVDTERAIWFLEINTIPGMTTESLLPQAIKVAGEDFGELLLKWIDAEK